MKKVLVIVILLSSCSTTKYHSNRFCVVVDDVVYNKRGTASIKPRTNKKGPEWWNGPSWYRYPNHNIRVGDTVEISMNDRIEPRF
jgi:hypothetical protein